MAAPLIAPPTPPATAPAPTDPADSPRPPATATTVEQGSAPIAYRIGSRTALQPGIDYYLCPDGHGLCQQSRP